MVTFTVTVNEPVRWIFYCHCYCVSYDC